MNNYHNSGQKQTGITGFLLRQGIVKTEQQAQYVLIGFVIVGLLVIIILNRPGAHTPPAVDAPEDVLLEEAISEEPLE